MSQKQKKKSKKLTDKMRACHISAPDEKPQHSGTVLAETYDVTLASKWPKLKEKVPDIFLHQPIDFAQHVRKLLSLGIQFYKPFLSRYHTKITCLSFDDHKAMIQYFEKKLLPYHTFGHPSKRKMKIVIKGLPLGIDLNKLKAELKAVSIPVIRVHTMFRRENIKDTNCLVLAVVPYSEEGKKLLQVKKILGYDIKLEPPISKTKQCHRCQMWGHTQRYCHGQVKCVKCAGEHMSKKCERDKDKVPPKCANCSGEHTANYKQCPCCPDSLAHILSQVQKNSRMKVLYRMSELVTTENVERLYKNKFYKPVSANVAL
ncbi:unnamed protein product [Colias eurytheme]|nr:unnamed protein product [Colias eurytheme]